MLEGGGGTSGCTKRVYKRVFASVFTKKGGGV